ncbi:MAG: hypothetical protein RLZZ114_817, partial [Bacteroidota bacterium]
MESTTQDQLIGAQVRLMPSASMPGADGGKPTPVAQALTASDGTFVLKDIPKGSYRLVINSLGFKPLVRPVEVNDAPMNLGKLSLTPQTQELREAKVVSDGPAQLNGIDRKVYDVKSDLQVQGGSGTDVLRQVPNVAIDIDGNIALRGQENVTILIDGRPASLLG